MKLFAIIRRLIAIAFFVGVIVLFAILKKNPDVAEAITRTISRYYCKGAVFVSGLAPHVSLTEIMFVIVIIVALVLVVCAIVDLFKFHPGKAICKLLDIALIASVIFALYSVACEAAYNRKAMPLPYYEQEVARGENGENFIAIYNYYANDVNACVAELEFDESGDVKSRKLDDIVKEVKEAYSIVTDPYFHDHFGNVKPMYISSLLYREFQITGVDFNALGEANINILNTHVNIPMTVAHELAHSKGIMREDDCNQLAFYVCLNSNSAYLRYSAYASYFYQIQSIGSGTYLTEEERTHLVLIDNQFNKTRDYVYKYWKKHDALAKFADFFNNLYLKSSGAQEGTQSYNGGTSYTYDPTQAKLYPSKYQKLFLEKYYRE